MARRYADELGELVATYEAARALGRDGLVGIAKVQLEFNRRDAYFVGSGGAIATAQMAASVHALNSTYRSRAVTPLSLAVGREMRCSNAVVGLFSARARHPDVRLAARAARAQPGNRVILITQLPLEDVSAGLVATVDEVVALPAASRDGFLATNSVLSMSASWLAAAGFQLPETLPMLTQELPDWPSDASRAVVVFGPDRLAAAFDMEARLSETGLLDVQLADLRNLAHGRHVGLLARSESTVVITLGDPSSQSLLDKTVDTLPDSVRVLDLSSDIIGPVGTLDSLVGSMRLVGAIGASRGVDPGQPRVSQAGRKLYHLPWSRLAMGPDGSRPVRTKALAAGMADTNSADLAAWSDSMRIWVEAVNGRRIQAVVLDYDGTCVSTPHRTSPPPSEVQAEILRLLTTHVKVAIASGRGPSVIEELRRWIPREHWRSVLVGIYNGGVINPLSDGVQRGSSATGELKRAADILRDRLVGAGWSISPRGWQITVERNGFAVVDAAASVAAVIGAEFGSSLKVIKSGHSVDIVPGTSSKREVVDRLEVERSDVLLVGDQGGVGGNDFELLSYSELSLSVDTVSADATRCWNLSNDGTSGPALLAGYLRAVVSRRGVARLALASEVIRGPQ